MLQGAMDKDLEMYEWMLKTCDQQLNLEFNNLTYSVSRGKSGNKCILNSVNGVFRSGKMTAILGPSGAGKTSLLNVLSGFVTTGVSGSITVNDKPRSLQEFKRQSCYIEQEFALLPLLSVRETLTIAADLKLGAMMNSYKKNTMVTEILELLGLEKSSNTLVKNLSGGEKKRVSIGLELLTNPPVMFFDEPTSGLDATSSVHMINHLKHLAIKGRTVICVIHQPSSQLFSIFDDVFILAGGEIIYGGPTSDMISAFAEAGFQCPNFYNPADFVIELATKHEHDGLLKKMVQNQKYSYTLNSSTKDVHNENKIPKVKGTCAVQNSYIVEKKTGTFTQFWILLKRSFLCRSRDVYMTYARLISNAIVGLLIGILYYNVGNDAEKVLTNIPCLFFFVYNFFFISILVSVLHFPEEHQVIEREFQNNWYSLGPYYFSKVLSDLPLQFLCPTLFIVFSYFLSGQPYDVFRFLLFWITCMLLVILGETYGFIFGTVFSKEVAVFMIFITGSCIGLFSGFLVRLNDLPSYLHWLSYFSCLRYAFEGVMISIYGFNRENLDCNIPFCYFRSSRKVLEEMHMDGASYISAMIGIIVWIFIYEVIFYFSLRFKLKKKN